MNIQILSQEVEHSLIFAGSLDDYETSSISHLATKVFLGSDSTFTTVVVFQNHNDVHFILDANVPAKLAFGKTFVVAAFESIVLLWRDSWLAAKKVDVAWTNRWMTFYDDRFVMMADDNCLIYINNNDEEIEYQSFDEIITEVRVEDGKLVVDLWK